MIKLVVFDLDGVLVLGSNRAFLDCFMRAMKEAGAGRVPRKRISQNFGKGYREIIDAAVRARDRDKTGIIHASFMRMISSGEIYGRVKLARGALPMLRSLRRRGLSVALATGNERHFLAGYLKHLKLSGRFDCVVSSDDVRHGKPSPDMLNVIMEKLRASPRETAYVGDAPNDIAMGKRAHARTIAVLTGVLDRKAARKLKPDYIIPTVASIRQCL